MFSGIHNYYEQMVFRRVQEVVRGDGEGYLEDVACIALNHLPSKYYRYSVDLASHISGSEQFEMYQEVAVAVDEAVRLVEARRSQRED
jgi:competence protein ComFB